MKGIVLPAPLNHIKVTLNFIIILPFNLVHLFFFLFHIEIEGKYGWIIGGPGLPCPPPPSSYAYGTDTATVTILRN